MINNASLNARRQLVSRFVQERKREGERFNTIVVFGREESGKSTLLEQLRVIYGNGYSSEERQLFLARIRAPCGNSNVPGT